MNVHGKQLLRVPHRINRSLRGRQEIPVVATQERASDERRTGEYIGVDAGGSKLNRGFHGIRHCGSQLAFVGKTSIYVSSNTTKERGKRGKELIPRITKNKARVDGKLFSNRLRGRIKLVPYIT